MISMHVLGLNGLLKGHSRTNLTDHLLRRPRNRPRSPTLDFERLGDAFHKVLVRGALVRSTELVGATLRRSKGRQDRVRQHVAPHQPHWVSHRTISGASVGETTTPFLTTRRAHAFWKKPRRSRG